MVTQVSTTVQFINLCIYGLCLVHLSQYKDFKVETQLSQCMNESNIT